ncbi:4Fe-4S binding protein [Trichlorobacter sp.]|uniref:4Fe-4S binding protein n=1 Tax=Trichlorobacter sp. TaxID=2911007 RepID=UPI0039C99826
METNAAGCILCSACVKVCPEQARILEHPMVNTRSEMLAANCSVRKERVCFVCHVKRERGDMPQVKTRILLESAVIVTRIAGVC